jgi:hypothetical protein
MSYELFTAVLALTWYVFLIGVVGLGVCIASIAVLGYITEKLIP